MANKKVTSSNKTVKTDVSKNEQVKKEVKKITDKVKKQNNK